MTHFDLHTIYHIIITISIFWYVHILAILKTVHNVTQNYYNIHCKQVVQPLSHRSASC